MNDAKPQPVDVWFLSAVIGQDYDGGDEVTEFGVGKHSCQKYDKGEGNIWVLFDETQSGMSLRSFELLFKRGAASWEAPPSSLPPAA